MIFTSLNSFTYDVCSALSDFNYRLPDKNMSSNQYVLNISYLKIDCNIIYFDVLKEKKGFLVSDFLHADGNILSYAMPSSKTSILAMLSHALAFYYGITSKEEEIKEIKCEAF